MAAESLEQIKERVEAAVPGASLTLVPNPGPAAQDSLVLDHAHAVEVATFLRDDPELRFDYCSNVTGVDWLDRVEKRKVRVMRVVEGEEREISEMQEERSAGYLEAVYHLYSMEKKHGPIVVRLRTEGRPGLPELPTLPSLTPVWRAAEFQEREIYDLFGINFDGHPDQRRILMWDEFEDHPMRKDYSPPDDYEYEPTPHDAVLERAKENLSRRPDKDGCESIV
jgi:NADH-quinone oxidoreductase subunit C